MVLPVWAFYLAIVVLLLGLIGVVLPAVPGVGLMWVVIVVYAIAERFATIDPLSFAVLTLLGAIGATSDLWLGQLGAQVAGASLWSTVLGTLGALLGGLVGFLVAGVGAVPGMWIGSMLGVLLNEYRERRDWRVAWKAVTGLAIGSLLSVVVEMAIGLTMIAIFVWQVLRG
ncbi:MAG: DUF456 domain-containing protein [Anaerolineae bacterium]|nr:DUF456 domain-containing protein [Anaerolineae bacterium]